MDEGRSAGDATFSNGWLFTTKTGLYGTDYLQRALVTAIGLGANRPQDAVYPTSEATRRQAVQRREQVRAALRQGQAAAGRWLLVADDVRRQLLLRRQSAESLYPEPAQQVQDQRRRFGRSLHPERVARQGQGSELAARAEGQVHPDVAAVLAEGEAALDPRRHLEDPAGEAGVLTENGKDQEAERVQVSGFRAAIDDGRNSTLKPDTRNLKPEIVSEP